MAGNADCVRCCSERMMALAAPWLPQIRSAELTGDAAAVPAAGKVAAAAPCPRRAPPIAAAPEVTNSRRDRLVLPQLVSTLCALSALFGLSIHSPLDPESLSCWLYLR